MILRQKKFSYLIRKFWWDLLKHRKQYGDKPAMVVELKWNQDADTALTQIHEKKYPAGLEEYKDNMLLVGISYDRETRKHECRIEKAI